jgi:predicted  nucleic acid-binding Zn-ribbon protein
MGLANFFGLLNSEADTLKERILFTQKSRITTLESQLERLRDAHDKRQAEIERLRENHERGKDKLVDHIVALSDKFADLNHKMLDIAHENARLKLLVESRKKK